MGWPAGVVVSKSIAVAFRMEHFEPLCGSYFEVRRAEIQDIHRPVTVELSPDVDSLVNLDNGLANALL